MRAFLVCHTDLIIHGEQYLKAGRDYEIIDICDDGYYIKNDLGHDHSFNSNPNHEDHFGQWFYGVHTVSSENEVVSSERIKLLLTWLYNATVNGELVNPAIEVEIRDVLGYDSLNTEPMEIQELPDAALSDLNEYVPKQGVTLFNKEEQHG